MGNLETPDTIRSLQRKLYLKAKSEPEFRFYLLYDKLYRSDILLHAYRLARANGGAPGVDGMTFEQIDQGEVGSLLAKLQEELKKQEYRPLPVRRVYIPKSSGNGLRPLGIPCIRDRVVQTAANLVLQPIFEADLTDNAYAYRPRKSAQDAVRGVHALLRQGYTDVVDADLSKYFDEIPHAELMRSVARRISDAKVLRLIKLWLKTPVEERDEKGNRRMTGGKGQQNGTPQGGVASPLLANIYMRRFLLAWRQHFATKLKAYVINYADDMVILCRGTAEKAKEAAEKIITGMKLRLNQEKTRVVDAWQQPFDFLGYTFGPCYAARSPDVYLGARPSKTRIKRLYGKVCEHLSRNNIDPCEEVIVKLNSMLTGWAQYFSYGTLTKAYRTVDWLTENRLRRWLCRRHKAQQRGTRQFSTHKLYQEYGLVCLAKRLAVQRSNA